MNGKDIHRRCEERREMCGTQQGKLIASVEEHERILADLADAQQNNSDRIEQLRTSISAVVKQHNLAIPRIAAMEKQDTADSEAEAYFAAKNKRRREVETALYGHTIT